MTTIRDTTKRKKNEETLRQSEQAVENICLVDAEAKRILESNPAFQETLGYAEEKLRRMTLYDVAAHARENVDANLRRVLEQKHHSIGQRKYRLKNGSLADVESARFSSTIGKPISREFRRESKE